MPIERERPEVAHIEQECDDTQAAALDLRPKNFTEYIGQRQVVETLEIAV